MSAHTPGPWFIPDQPATRWTIIKARTPNALRADCSVAYVPAGPNMINDAHTLKAVPELVALAEAIILWYENAGDADPIPPSPGSVHLWSAAREALLKAKGVV